MQPRITVLTLGVDNLDRAVRFYRDGLGLHTEGIVGSEFEHGSVAFFPLHGGLTLAVWPRESLAHDSGLPKSDRGTTEFSIGHNVASEQEVETIMKQAVDAGAHLVKRAQKTFYGGYAGYFQDRDGHLWEIAFNPKLIPKE